MPSENSAMAHDDLKDSTWVVRRFRLRLQLRAVARRSESYYSVGRKENTLGSKFPWQEFTGVSTVINEEQESDQRDDGGRVVPTD